ncbi:MAG: DUF4652 domain-containing protein [Ectobacillus sp.]
MYKLEYDYDDRVIYKVIDGQKEKMDLEYPSEPVLAPDGKKYVFIDPLEWECLGSLYLFDNMAGEIKTLIKPEESYIPKYVKWLDERTLAVIIGFGYGTVAIGGNIYSFDVETKEKKPITHFDSRIQITSLEVIDSNTLKYTGIKYVDDIMSEFIAIEETIQLP